MLSRHVSVFCVVSFTCALVALCYPHLAGLSDQSRLYNSAHSAHIPRYKSSPIWCALDDLLVFLLSVSLSLSPSPPAT